MLSARTQLPMSVDNDDTHAIDGAAMTKEDGSFALVRRDPIPKWVRCLLDCDCRSGLTVHAHLGASSARTFATQGLAAVKNDGEGTAVFDLREFPFAPGEENRTLANIAVLFPGATGAAVDVHLHVTGPQPADVEFAIADSIALSNGEPLRLPGSIPPGADLNAAIGAAADQPWSIELKSSPGADLSDLADVIIGIGYTADPV
jgi:hypothetical protein